MADDAPAEEVAAAVEEPVAEEAAAPAAPTAEEEAAAAPAAEEPAAEEPAAEEPVVEEPVAEEPAAAVEVAVAETPAAAPASASSAFGGVSWTAADQAKIRELDMSELAGANPLVKMSKANESCKDDLKTKWDTCQAKYCVSSYKKVPLSEEEEQLARENPTKPPVNGCAMGARACKHCGAHGSPKEFLAYNLFDVANMTVAILMFLCYGLRIVITYDYTKTPKSWAGNLHGHNDAARNGFSRGYMSGPYGSGEFIITLLIAIVATGIFVAKLIRHVFCPDRLELARRKDYDQLESYRSIGGSSA